jgi:1-acyl-sn-glycerol-3-phosphate acyltransferase
MRIIDFSPAHRFLSAVFFWPITIPIIVATKLLFSLRIYGRENLYKVGHKGFFLISNHSLYLDPAIIVHAIMPRRAFYSALQQHFTTPLLGSFIRYLGAFPIPKNRGLERIAQPIKIALSRGWLVHFFPEGEMTHMNPDIEPFRMGVFFLAHRLGTPVVPLTIVKQPRRLFGLRIKAVFGAPIFPAEKAESWPVRKKAIETMARESLVVMRKAIADVTGAKRL